MENTVVNSAYSDWLEGFYGRFEADTKKLYEIEPFWRICRKCPDGYCCTRISYAAQNWEGDPFIIEDWTRMLLYVRDRFSSEQKSRLIRTVLSNAKNCIFVAEGRCSIHPARPWSCRTHPYTVSFHQGQGIFPTGELALPSCPSLGPQLGIKKDQLLVQQARVIEKNPGNNLVKLKLKKRKPVWLLDATSYIGEYQANVPPASRPVLQWQRLFALAEEAGGERGSILAEYVEAITALKPRA